VGKTTVGQLVAAKLGTRFVDVDRVIEEHAAKAVAQLFAEDGEAAFRELERTAMGLILASEPCVVAPGGGWAAQQGNLESVAGRAIAVYLVAAPEIVAERARQRPGIRPLLAGDERRRMRELFVARRRFYEACEATVDAGRDGAGAVADDVVNLARSRAGWY
jgi:shikimate kinase